MVERSLSMREVPGSIPGISKPFFLILALLIKPSFFELYLHHGYFQKILGGKQYESLR